MTANQTIDGVPRELLDKAFLDAQRVRFDTDKQVIELRDPLDKPGPCSQEWTDDGEFTLTCTKCGKTENHEPYGWVQTRGNAINHFTQEWDVVESWEDQGFEYKAMFDHAEHPAPVSVVLPERQPGDDGVCTESHYASGWNSCIDELKRLNPSL
ncbi:hypothetical protein EXW72_10265 [Pseudomonas sp. BCA14]|uniref:hypothetical protein n=1 Tax=unclassified Pseudomonas TaxID=196821 RepID=UPI00106E5A9D|nr:MULTISPECIES: hypothetical protein [unclassified Pseudomonas]TFF09704.1 hypothetical protein EXW70_11765 [Pseudomonas sp. JMN1]TFF11846.1 hypothetical protein EXW71_09515 [Pseudomonas sp. BCA17]TFF28622.1 hypothetical protein EXW72_10265 [Pseudomonas sp. BCA14]